MDLWKCQAVSQETGNNHSENPNDNEKMKMTSDLGEHKEYGWEQKPNKRVLWWVIWKTPDNKANKRNCYYDVYILQ